MAAASLKSSDAWLRGKSPAFSASRSKAMAERTSSSVLADAGGDVDGPEADESGNGAEGGSVCCRMSERAAM